ncbi:MAG: methylmalonyl Co-A mutase-associated GTPase MeaB [Rhodospirillales bacterium]
MSQDKTEDGAETAAVLAGLAAQDRKAIARALTWAEAGAERRPEFFTEIFRRAGRAHVVGVTGVPGSGKSTLVTALTQAARKDGRKDGRTVGVIAVDPSSPFSGGSILGDRVRMGPLAGDDGVFIRSMATGGALGGLAAPALDAVDVLDAAGFDMVLIETVGVGQDEVDIAQAAHTVVVVSAPGLGDGVQAVKAGVLEIADIHAVSKCDRPDAQRTVADLQSMLTLGRSPGRYIGRGAALPVIATSAETGEGVDKLLAAVDAHAAALAADSGEGAEARRAERLRHRILKTAETMLRKRLAAGPLERAAQSMTGAPFQAAQALLREISGGGKKK